MSNEELQAIREFLRGLDYQITPINYLPNPAYWLYSHANEDTWLGKETSEKEAMASALNHYLSNELGVHWRKMWKILNNSPSERHWIANWEDEDIFDAKAYDILKQAIDYLEQLEKGE